MTQLIHRQTEASTDGIELAYWAHRARHASGQSLLLLHGGASNHTRWSEFVAESKPLEDWNIIVPDMRGNGASMTRTHIDMATWCADLQDIISAEGVASVVIIGHSLGAQIAVQFADRTPKKTSGLILIDPVFQSSLRGRSLWIQQHQGLVRLAVACILGLNRLGLRRRKFQIPNLRELDVKTRAEIEGAETFAEIEKRYSALWPIIKHMPVANYLRQALATVSPLPPFAGIKVPVLALLSGGTTVGDLDISRCEIAAFASSEVVILHANHWPLTETPEAVREAIEAWLLSHFAAVE